MSLEKRSRDLALTENRPDDSYRLGLVSFYRCNIAFTWERYRAERQPFTSRGERFGYHLLSSLFVPDSPGVGQHLPILISTAGVRRVGYCLDLALTFM